MSVVSYERNCCECYVNVVTHQKLLRFCGLNFLHLEINQVILFQKIMKKSNFIFTSFLLTGSTHINQTNQIKLCVIIIRINIYCG